jgi:hypothetical protein
LRDASDETGATLDGSKACDPDLSPRAAIAMDDQRPRAAEPDPT